MHEASETIVDGRVVRLLCRRVGAKFVFTSLDVPELHISHADVEEARLSVPSAVEGIARVKRRLAVERDQQMRIIEFT